MKKAVPAFTVTVERVSIRCRCSVGEYDEGASESECDSVGYARRIHQDRSEGDDVAMTTFNIETEREDDGRWIAEVVEIAGAMAYGSTREQAVAKAQAIALRITADRVEHGELGPEFVHVSFQAA